jgi:transcriptional regulator with PAS, ATPase and Fis domain
VTVTVTVTGDRAYDKTMSDPSPDSTPRGTWAALFHQTADPVFLLNPRRRVRFVNRAFETVARTAADAVLHEYCHPRKLSKSVPAAVRSLLQAMAPPKEAMRGQVTRVRRPAPPARFGPPWWDLTFVPLRDGDKLLGVIGFVAATGAEAPAGSGKGLSEALIGLRQSTIERAAAGLYPGDSADARRIRSQAELAAKTLSPVWIVGSPGTGKETLARAIHARGVSRERAFVAVDCGGLQPYLIRALLFGHNGLVETGRVGTIYLKGPEGLPPDLQDELIEWGELLEDECRVMVGTHLGEGLSPEFQAAFRVLEIHLPDVAARLDELPRLLATWAPTAAFTAEAIAVLAGSPWPANLRELRAVVRDAVQRANGGRVEVGHLPLALRRSAADARAAAAAEPRAPSPKLDDVLEQVEKRMIELALRKAKGDQTAAADALGVYRSRLVRRIKALGLGDD